MQRVMDTYEVMELGMQVKTVFYKEGILVLLKWEGVVIMKWIIGGVCIMVIVPVTMLIAAAVAIHTAAQYQLD